MSLTDWLKKANPSLAKRYPDPKGVGLPNPNDAKTDANAASWAAANKAVEEGTPPFKKPMRRSHYHVYDADVRLQMAKSAVSRGIAATCRKFSVELKHDVPMSTVKIIDEECLLEARCRRG